MNRLTQLLFKSTFCQFYNKNFVGYRTFASVLASDDDKIRKLFDLIKDIRFSMITTLESDKSLRSRPMANLQVDSWNGILWFYTRRSSHKVEEIQQNLDQINVSYSDPNSMSFVSLSGKAELVDDPHKLKQHWSPYLQVFFPKGLNDPDLALLKVTVSYGEYWDSPSGKMVQLYSMVKTMATGNPANLGVNEKIDMEK